MASSAAVVGRHVKIFRRLAVSDTPVTVWGPVMAKSRRCGSPVMPNVSPVLVSASVCSIGVMMSSIGPSANWTNAADTRCGPAVTWIGGVCRCCRNIFIGVSASNTSCPVKR